MRRFIGLLSLACLLAVPVVENDALACTKNVEDEAAITVDKTSATTTIANEKNADANLDRAMATAATQEATNGKTKSKFLPVANAEALTCKKAITTQTASVVELVAITLNPNLDAHNTAAQLAASRSWNGNEGIFSDEIALTAANISDLSANRLSSGAQEKAVEQVVRWTKAPMSVYAIAIG